MKTLEEQQQLSDSLLTACKAAGIEKPDYVMQRGSGIVYHMRTHPDVDSPYRWTPLIHPPYTTDWQDSLLEFVDHVADTSKKIDDAIRIGYHKHVVNGDGLYFSRANDYRQGWQDALALRDGGNQASGIEAMVCDDIAKRQQVGIAKYGTTVAENPLSHMQWLQHAYEECLDMAVYLKRAMEERIIK